VNAAKDYDLFVSYASADNDLAKPFDLYVFHFVEALRSNLRAKLGGDEPRIYIDKSNLQANHRLSEIIDACKSSKLLLAFASPAYHKREWTRKELDAFMSQSTDPRRVFVVELGKHDEGCLQEIAERHVMRLYEETPFHGTEALLMERSGMAFAACVNSLAGQMRDELKALRSKSDSIAGAAARTLLGSLSPNGSATSKPILLAQVTDDLEDERKAVQSYLEQYGYSILPREEYPQGAVEFEAALKTDLEQCGLFVQLLGPRSGRTPPDLKVSYGRFQYDTAKLAEIDIMQWRRSDIQVERIEDGLQRDLLSGEYVTASTLEQFKSDVLQQLQTPPPQPQPTKAGLFLLVNTEDADRRAAESMAEKLKNAYTVALPMQDAEASVQSEFNGHLKECDALFLMYGDAPQDWVRRQLANAHKVRAVAGKLPLEGAVCYGPPSNKPDVGFFVPGMKKVDCSNGRGEWCVDSVLQMLAEWRT